MIELSDRKILQNLYSMGATLLEYIPDNWVGAENRLINPAVKFAHEVKNNEWDDVSDQGYESALEATEYLVVFWGGKARIPVLDLARNVAVVATCEGRSWQDVAGDFGDAVRRWREGRLMVESVNDSTFVDADTLAEIDVVED